MVDEALHQLQPRLNKLYAKIGPSIAPESLPPEDWYEGLGLMMSKNSLNIPETRTRLTPPAITPHRAAIV